jgi:hypothetical protein
VTIWALTIQAAGLPAHDPSEPAGFHYNPIWMKRKENLSQDFQLFFGEASSTY